MCMTKKNKKKEEKLYMLHDDRLQLTPEQETEVARKEAKDNRWMRIKTEDFLIKSK